MQYPCFNWDIVFDTQGKQNPVGKRNRGGSSQPSETTLIIIMSQFNKWAVFISLER